MSYARHPDLSGGAADAPGVGRARAAHATERQRMIQPRNCCGPTANACESGMRALSQGTHPVPGRAITGNALGRYPRPRIRQSSWWERNRGPRPRAPSRGTHPTAIVPVSVPEKRPRRPSPGTPSGAHMAGRLSRTSGVVPPNQRMQPDAVPATRSCRFYVVSSPQTPSRSLGAARLMRHALAASCHPCARRSCSVVHSHK